MNAKVAVEVLDLSRAFGGIEALRGLSFRVTAGTVHGFLGPNGAGKTTAIRIIATLLPQDSGQVRVFGKDTLREASAVRRHLCLAGQHASVDVDMSGRENLIMAARLAGFSWRQAKVRAEELLQSFGLRSFRRLQVKKYSGGMQRKLDLAASIVSTPDLLILDEPTTGLDPASRRELWRTIRNLAAEGVTILLTTQYRVIVKSGVQSPESSGDLV